MKDPVCVRCGTVIYLKARSDTIRCRECGAFYELKESEVKDQHIDYEYELIGFKCTYEYGLEACNEICPAPNMYCWEHVSDNSFESAKRSIVYAENRLEEAKDQLERMEESKKIWLIREVSGIDD